jgi:hypothetical protein
MKRPDKRIDTKKYSHWSTQEEEPWNHYRMDLELRMSSEVALELIHDLTDAMRFAKLHDKPYVTLHVYQVKEDV